MKKLMIHSLCILLIFMTAIIPIADSIYESEKNESNESYVISDAESNGNEKSAEPETQNKVPQTGDSAMIWCLAAAVCLGIMTFIVSPKPNGQYSE